MTETTWPVEAAATPIGMRLPADLRAVVDESISQAVGERWASRIWDRDTSVWTAHDAVAARISERLGWLDAPATFAGRVEELEAFATGIRSEGFTAAFVCGMGGSSLAPEVLARAYAPGEGGLDVAVLDSTDPAAVAAAREATDATSTLYLIATKSGTTTETLSFLAYFWELQDELHGSIPDSRPGEHFVAITDPGRSVEAIPHTEAFRSVFLNPPDVGGRYSALTYVGLVPAALLALDLRGLVAEASRMAEACRADAATNPGLALGATLGALARAGRDKLTLVLEPELAAFGAWLEQLIAESTGKQGTGIVPVDGEPVGAPEVYGPDRVFLRLGREDASDWRAETDGMLDALAAAGHPVLDVAIPAGAGLGGEFFRWEFATAVAGAVLRVDPFDEPNVTESKENTNRVLAEAHETGRLPVAEALSREGPLELVGDAPLRLTQGPSDLPGQLARHLHRPASYVGIQAYLAPTPERDELLARLRLLIRDRTHRATTVGYGPRFLHSTGQLHKGGPRSGCFVQLVAGRREDLPIPGSDASFGRLIDAQALGDFVSLESHELPVVRIHLGDDPEAGLAALLRSLATALPEAG
jgi:glucose-6-phosphate isomerase